MKASGYNRYLGISPVEVMQKSAYHLKFLIPIALDLRKMRYCFLDR